MIHRSEGSVVETHPYISYLFKWANEDITLLEEDTYIINALNSSNIRHGYQLNDEIAEEAFISRWPDNKFPLKIFIAPDYGVLLSPKELRQVTQICQDALARIQAINPECFQFNIIEARHQADIVVKFRRSEELTNSHNYPQIGPEKQIQKAEMTLNIPKAIEEEQILKDMMHNLLHALGVYGHSDYEFDCAYSPTSSKQQILTVRDIKTLQLLYRCPIGMTKKDLMLLWTEYQNNYLTIPLNSALEAILSNIDKQDSTLLIERKIVKSADLSQREVALQQFFSKYIQELQSA